MNRDVQLLESLTRAVGPSLLFRNGRLHFDDEHHPKPILEVVQDPDLAKLLEAGGLRTLGDLHGKDFEGLRTIEGVTVDRYYFLLLGLRAAVQRVLPAEPVVPESEEVPVGLGSAEELLDVLGEAFWPEWADVQRPLMLGTFGTGQLASAGRYRAAAAIFFASFIRSPRFESFALACMSNADERGTSLAGFQRSVETALGWVPAPTDQPFRVLLHALQGLQVAEGPDGPLVVIA